MRPCALLVAALTVGLAACSGGGISTASILGEAPKAPPPAPINDPTSRAFNVGLVTARATKCGYNFDPAKLKANYFAAEAALGTPPEEMAKVEKVYGVALNGVTKAAATEPDYCNPQKTKEIKEDLARLLAGDFTPPARKPAVEEEDGGLFSGWGSSDGSSKGVNSRPPTANEEL